MEKLLYTLANGGIPQEEKQLKMCDLLNREFISGKLIKWVIKNHTPIGFLKLSNDKEYPKIEEIESPDYGEYGRLLNQSMMYLRLMIIYQNLFLIIILI